MQTLNFSQNWLLGHLEAVATSFTELRSVEISPGGYSEARRPKNEVLDEQASVIRSAKVVRQSLVKVSFNGLGHWHHEDGLRWTYKDSWKTEYSTST